MKDELGGKQQKKVMEMFAALKLKRYSYLKTIVMKTKNQKKQKGVS